MVNRPILVVYLSYLCLIILTVIVIESGWVNPSYPSDRDFVVWGNKYVTDYDKSALMMETLAVPADGSNAPLQSTPVVKWGMILVYDPDGSTTNLWTKETLIAIRDFESDIKAKEKFKKVCLADPVPDGAADEVFCSQKALSSPLNLFPDQSMLENLT